MNTEKALRDRIKNDRRQFVTHRERINELDKELREARKLIVAFITQSGKVSNKDNVGTYELFLDDRNLANVAYDDRFEVRYSDTRRGNIYTVSRKGTWL